MAPTLVARPWRELQAVPSAGRSETQGSQQYVHFCKNTMGHEKLKLATQRSFRLKRRASTSQVGSSNSALDASALPPHTEISSGTLQLQLKQCNLRLLQAILHVHASLHFKASHYIETQVCMNWRAFASFLLSTFLFPSAKTKPAGSPGMGAGAGTV